MRVSGRNGFRVGALTSPNSAHSFRMHRAMRRFVADDMASMPLHVAKKKIPTIDEAGVPVKLSSPNGVKLELFIFDTFPHARVMKVFEVDRKQAFAPVKNPPVSDCHSEGYMWRVCRKGGRGEYVGRVHVESM